jgi:hypothetical protein
MQRNHPVLVVILEELLASMGLCHGGQLACSLEVICAWTPSARLGIQLIQTIQAGARVYLSLHMQHSFACWHPQPPSCWGPGPRLYGLPSTRRAPSVHDKPVTMVASGLAVGLNKGHVVTKRELPARASRRKGVSLCSGIHQSRQVV